MKTLNVILLIVALGTLGACTRTSPGSDIDASTAPDGNLQPDSSTAVDAQVDPCAAEVAALAQEIYTLGCSAVVRLDHDTREILGYQLICGGYSGATEATARAEAQAATGFGAGGTMLNSMPPVGPYVFYEAPGDFGGVAAVSGDSGRALFGGSIIWLGTGDLTYPTTWRPASELASGCNPSGGPGSALGYDLVADGAPLSASDVDAAIAVVADTALMQAFWGGGYVFSTVVLRYPRAVGAFDPSTAEWIVIVSGGWLE